MKIFKTLMFIAAAAMAFTGCSKEDAESALAGSEKVSVKAIANSPATRTYIGEATNNTYPVLWAEEGESLALVEIIDGSTTTVKAADAVKSNATYTVTNEGKTADFTFELTENTTGSSYDYYVTSPASALYNFSAYYGNFNITVPSEQTPTLTSADPAASVLVAVANMTAQPTEANPLNLVFKHAMGYGKMTVKGLNAAEDEVVMCVSISATGGQNMAGGYYYYYGEEGEDSTYNQSSTLTMDMEALNIAAGENFDVWFASKPCALENGFSVKVITNKATYVRIVENTTLKFVKGQVSRFGVDMATAEKSTMSWPLITNINQLKSGALVAIVSAEEEYGMAALNGTYYTQAPVVKGNNELTAVDDAVEIFKVTNAADIEEGWSYFLFEPTVNATSKYLYYNGSSNSISQGDTETISYFWNVNINTDGVAVVSNCSDNARKLQHNSPSTRFATYLGTQNDLQLYLVKEGDGVANKVFAAAAPAEVLTEATTVDVDVKATVAWTATVSGGATFVDGATEISGEGSMTLPLEFAANTDTENDKVFTVVVTTEEEVATKSYTLTITQPKAIAAGTEVTSVFIDEYKFAHYSATGTNEATDGTVTIVQAKGTSSNAVGNGYLDPIRFYVGHTLTFTGATITKIEFTYNTGKTPKALTILAGGGNFTLSGTTGTWVNEAGATEVQFTTGTQVRFDTIKVTYTK